MAFYSLVKIAEITNGKLQGESGILIRQLLIDSRSAAASPETLFFAIHGNNHDGHRYVPELYHRGVRAFVISGMKDEYLTLAGAGFVVVKDTLRALQEVAAFHRNQFRCPVIAISGSNGKTIVKEWLYHCLSGKFQITRSPKSYNSQVGVPLSLWLIDDNTAMGIFEAGISAPGEMKKLQQMITPDVGIFTNIGEAHQENFRDIDQKIAEKLTLFYGCQILIYCADHMDIDRMLRNAPELKKTRLIGWSAEGKGVFRISDIRRANSQTSFTASYEDREIGITIPFSDSASLENAVHCVAFMCWLGIESEAIIARMADLPPVAMRLEQKSAINGCTLINDSYNSDINSLSIALELLNQQLQHSRKTLILSDILQTGKKQEELYALVDALLKEKKVSRIVGIGPSIQHHASLFTIPGKFYSSTQAFIESFDTGEFRNEAILVKGSRQFEFERITTLLEQKKHTTRIEINLSALIHNLNYFRSLLRPGTKTMVMVKALSYGSGRHEIANILQFQRVDYLGVAIADEGVSLRQSGITIPIMVMNPEPESFDTLIAYKLEPEIYSLRIMDMFKKAIIRNQEINYPIHLKIDSGMHRMGFLPDDTEQLCLELSKLGNVKVSSIFSHLAGSDEAVLDDFTAHQIDLFRKVSDAIIATLGYPVIRHILNTTGIERFPEAQFDMVRLGIGLYGVGSTSPGKLRTVSTLRSTILQIKPVLPGETVGYGRMGKPDSPRRIAVVPIGYADGLSRRLSNGKGKFLVKEKLAPIVGNICMDMTMIDVTETGAAEGDEVVIFGEKPSIITLAADLETIPYEILTGISERVKRVYIHE